MLWNSWNSHDHVVHLDAAEFVSTFQNPITQLGIVEFARYIPSGCLHSYNLSPYPFTFNLSTFYIPTFQNLIIFHVLTWKLKALMFLKSDTPQCRAGCAAGIIRTFTTLSSGREPCVKFSCSERSGFRSFSHPGVDSVWNRLWEQAAEVLPSSVEKLERGIQSPELF